MITIQPSKSENYIYILPLSNPQIPFDFPVVPIMSFTTKGSVQSHALTCHGSSFPLSAIGLQSSHNFHGLDKDYRPVL